MVSSLAWVLPDPAFNWAAGDIAWLAPALLFIGTQWFTRLSLRIRVLGSASAGLLLFLTFEVVGMEGVAGSAVLSVLLLGGKWFRDVFYDVQWREDERTPLLVKDWRSMNLYLNPFYTLLYHHRMFRDSASNRHIRREAIRLPTWLED